MINYKETKYGFEYGSLAITRTASDEKTGGVVVTCKSPKASIDVYATKTGKIRVYMDGIELKKMGER